MHVAFLSTAPSVPGNAHSINYSIANTPFSNVNCFNSPRCLSGHSYTTGTPSLGALTLNTGNGILNPIWAGIGEASKSHFEREPNDKNYFSWESCTPEVDLPVYSTHGARDTLTA